MAACSVYVPYLIQHPSSEMMSEERYRKSSTGSSGGPFIREEIMFAHGSGHSCGSSSPRRGSGTSDSSDYTGADRRASVLQEYFKSTNALARSIMLEKSTVENEHGHSWTVLSDSRRDEIVDDHFVPTDVREQYTTFSRRSASRLSSYSQENEYDVPDREMVRMLSQPIESESRKIALGKSRSLTHTPQDYDFSRNNKLRSNSIRTKKSPISARKIFTDEVIPLFERDVNDLDNEVDLPDDSLINDHVDSPSDESFQRLRPLRYSFGRKLKHKVDHAHSSTDLTKDFVIANESTDSSSMHDLSQVGRDFTDGMSDFSGHKQNDILFTIGNSSLADDNISMTSRQSLNNTPEPHSFARGRLSLRTESPLKHPLSRSVRAGSSYMTATSELADRRQLFKSNIKRKTNSANSTRENTPLPPEDAKKEVTIQLPVTVTGPDTNTSVELISPMCSPPSSPAAHGHMHSKRESGYISSLEASDEEEVHNNSTRSKRRNNRILHVESTLSTNYH